MRCQIPLFSNNSESTDAVFTRIWSNKATISKAAQRGTVNQASNSLSFIATQTNADLIQYNLRLIASLAHCNTDWQRLDDWYQVKKNQHNKINAKVEIKEVLNE
ncbi:hypothetical protein [Shewanella surugensis]|uniref:Uncharacterized protein n=1 Tax=Shewanella surugensis TaxID=212020 RepID=A0ABT0LC26_9GAMM|nr:hypothetical protein [Shewanella surugensis]MCL1125218.1 hypothetical protein [Shewanella surugensis]